MKTKSNILDLIEDLRTMHGISLRIFNDDGTVAKTKEDVLRALSEK